MDSICITDHDVFAYRKVAKEFQEKHGILVIVDTEILTEEGDFICFGLNEIPRDIILANRKSCKTTIEYIDDLKKM